MKKLLVVVIGVLVIAGAAVAYLATNKDDTVTTTETQQSSTNNTEADSQFAADKKACDILTIEVAQQILGPNAEAASTNADEPTVGDDVVVNSCNYGDGTASLGESKAASLLIRAAKTSEGAESNKSQFTDQKPAEAEDVSGYGEAAYWNPTFGQFNVLNDGNWYVISNGPLKPAEKTLDQAKQLADLIKDKF